jgi:GntR family transcriptional repressor for pyruvate dehydrogenase complex
MFGMSSLAGRAGSLRLAPEHAPTSATTRAVLELLVEAGMARAEPHMDRLLEAQAEIETIVAGLAAQRSSADEITALRERLSALHRAGDDVDAYLEADRALHLELARASCNTVFANLVDTLRSLVHARLNTVSCDGRQLRMTPAMQEHLITAVAARDAQGAREAMKAHLDGVHRQLREALDTGERASES